MNKRKPDDEFANIDLSYFDANGREAVVSCPESINATATLEPMRKSLCRSGGSCEQKNCQRLPPESRSPEPVLPSRSGFGESPPPPEPPACRTAGAAFHDPLRRDGAQL
jgi:ATP-dependent Lon protease